MLIFRLLNKWSILTGILCCFLAFPAFAAERPQRVKAESPPPVAAPTILSIIPAQAEPNQKVIIFGSAFGDRVSAFLGSQEIAAKVVDGKQVEFVIPGNLPAGLYALYLKRSDGVTGRAYNFTVLPLRPILSDLNPSRISACAEGRDREITASGQNFSDGSFVMLDGAVIRSKVNSSDSISFTLPQVQGGLHQIVVKNSPENSSVPMALTIETRPEISNITVGNEHVNYYDLVIEGRNFQQNSAIYVDGQRIGGRLGQEVAEREKLIYIDCTRLIYQRYPVTPVTKDFHVQVVNPGGEGSQVVNVTAP